MKNTLNCEREFYTNTVPIKEYIEDCVDVPKFLSYCRQCSNFGKTWSCPEFSFDPVDYWKQYSVFQIIGMKILVPPALREKTFDDRERDELIKALLETYKKEFDDFIMETERKTEGGVGLGGGSCLRCSPLPCSRVEGKPCRQPGKMRYSIEALGGDVGRTVSKYLGQELCWIKDGKLPTHFMLVGGVLS